MKSSLIPEKPLLIYPSLAATVGLEESIMLSVLSELGQTIQPQHSNGFYWATLTKQDMCDAMPFWDIRDIQRISVNLREKGILLLASAPFGETEHFKFAFNERVQTSHVKPQHPVNTQPANQQSPAPDIFQKALQPSPFSKHHIPPNWQPSQDTLAQLAQHNIPQQFANEHVPEFVNYWRERKETHASWGGKFMQHILFKWRTFEKQQHQKDQELPISPNWRPSPDAMEVLTKHAEINPDFIEDAIPEFILYWQERGDSAKTWNTKFIQHIRIQWKKYQSSVEHNTDPKPIPSHWQPSADVYDVLRLANISIPFAQQLLPEFILYWKDSNQLHTSWNTRFLQHVKKYWAKHHHLNQHAGQKDTGSTSVNRSTREISLNEELNDRSWAN